MPDKSKRSDKEYSESFNKSQKEQKYLLQKKIDRLEKSTEELSSRIQHLQQLIGNAGQIFTIVNPKGTILYSGPSLKRILGYNPDDVTDTYLFNYIHPDDKEGVKQILKDISESTGASGSFDFRHKHRDDSWRHLECFATNAEDIIYGPGVYLSLWDVTEHAESLKKVKNQLTFAQRTGRIGSWEWNVERDQLTWTKELGRIFGIDRDEFPSTLHEYLQLLHPEDRSEAEDLLKQTIESGSEYGYEFRIKRPDGDVRFLYGRGEMVPDDEGEIVKMIGTIQDLTEIKATKQKLHSFDRRVKKLVTEKDKVRENERIRIAREIHDELGQLLTVLKIDVSLAIKRNKKVQGDKPLTRFSEEMSQVTGRIDSIIQTVQRIATELRPEILVDFGLIEAIEWQAAKFQKRTGINLELIHLQSSFDQLDKEQASSVFRIFQEILTNIMKHSKASGVQVLLKEDESNLILKVSDDGTGMNLMEKESSESLGIIGMRERSDALGGSIELKSVPDEGTTITLKIPYTRRKQISSGSEERVAVYPADEEIIKVVIADDHPLVCEGLKKVVSEESKDIRVVHEVSTGSELLDILSVELPHIVVLDIILPDINGLDLLKKIGDLYPDLPVLVLTIHPEQGYAAKAMKAGAAGYLNKSVVADELVVAINDIIKKKKRYINPSVSERLADDK